MTTKVEFNGHIYDIDTGITHVIKTLNEKGYKTTMCCEGHKCDTTIGYTPLTIHFEIGNLPPRPVINGFTRHCRQFGSQRYPSYNYGGHFRHCRPYNRVYQGHYIPTIDFYYSQYKKVDQDAEKEYLLAELNKWVDNLPIKNEADCLAREKRACELVGKIDFTTGEYDDYYERIE